MQKKIILKVLYLIHTDNIVFISKVIEETQRALNHLIVREKKFGVYTSYVSTKFIKMYSANQNNYVIDEKMAKQVVKFKHFGTFFFKDKSLNDEINVRLLRVNEVMSA